MNENALFHLPITRDFGARYAILPGDPGRVEKIAALLDKPAFVGSNREYTIWQGMLCGQMVLVCSTGIGGPSAAIAVEELSMAGVDTFLRVGTCGGMQQNVCSGDLVIATGAVRLDGTSREYAPIEFPAVADFHVTQALEASAQALHVPHHVGVVQSKDSFYGQHDPQRMPVSYTLMNQWEAYIACGALASEMECATLFTCAAALGKRAGAVLLAIWNQEREKAGLPNPQHHDTTLAIRTAVSALETLVKQD